MRSINRLAVLIQVSGLLFSACTFCVRPAPILVQRITVEEDALILDGRRLAAPMLLDDLIEILGEPDDAADYENGITWRCWDANGINASPQYTARGEPHPGPVRIEAIRLAMDESAHECRGSRAPFFKGVLSVAGVAITARTPNREILRPGSPIRADEPGGRSDWTYPAGAFDVSHYGRGYFPYLITIRPRTRVNY